MPGLSQDEVASDQGVGPWSQSFGRTLGRVQGTRPIQIRTMRLRQRMGCTCRSPRTNGQRREPSCFCSEIAPGGQRLYKPAGGAELISGRSGPGGRYQWHVGGDACQGARLLRILRLIERPVLA